MAAAHMPNTIPIKIKFRIPWSLAAVMVIFFIFSELYVKLVVPTFNWGGMTLNPRDNRILEYTLLVVTTLFLQSKTKGPADFYFWLHFIMLLIPSAVLSAEQSSNRFHMVLMFAALWLSMLFHRLLVPIIIRGAQRNSINNKRLPYYSVIIIIMIVLIFLAISVKGVFNLDFQRVYEYRFDISENMPLLLRYMMPLASGSLIGYVAAMAVSRKDIKGLIIIAIAGILFFGFSSHKSMLFNPIVAISGYFLLKNLRPHLLILGALSVCSIILLIMSEESSSLLGSLFANRLIFIPSQINYFYFDFFSSNPKMLWADSKISMGLVSSELPIGVMNYIGGLMTGNFDITANTGWIANAYMNAGVGGIFIYAIFISLLFALIDFWAFIYGKQLIGSAFLIPVTAMIFSADLLIVLLTSGLYALLIIFTLTSLKIRVRKPCKVNKMQIIETLHA